MTDHLSLFVTGHIAETYVKKIFKLMSVVVICSVIWAAVDLLEWYVFIDNSPGHSKLTHPFYRYKIWPIIGIIELSISLSVNILAYQARGNLQTYIETSDDDRLCKGLKTFYSMAIITIVWFIISILNVSYRMFFYE